MEQLKPYFPYLFALVATLLFFIVNLNVLEEDELPYDLIAKQFFLMLLLTSGMAFGIEYFSQSTVSDIVPKISKIVKTSEAIIPGPPRFSPF